MVKMGLLKKMTFIPNWKKINDECKDIRMAININNAMFEAATGGIIILDNVHLLNPVSLSFFLLSLLHLLTCLLKK